VCGICGRVSIDSGQTNVTFVERMMLELQHRGPDDHGLWHDSKAALGHRRLSIIDLSSAGHQPMLDETGRYVLIFNGEIYNYAELREQFKSDIEFQRNNDSEVILKLYAKLGPDCLKYFRGMFSFAIWDSEQQQLFFARDCVGKKPFYYSLQKNRLVFASEMHALLANSDFDFQINEEAIYQYLSLMYVPSPITIYENVFKLPAGHYGILKSGQLKIERYWDLDFTPVERARAEALSEFEKLWMESIKRRLISDVPLGAFLSGGLDSSAVVATMSQLSSKPVETFTIRFPEKEFNEADYAQEVANHCHANHHEFLVDDSDFLSVVPELVKHYSEPFADPSAVPVYYLSKMTRDHVTVALNGDGGDEGFGGYPRYQINPTQNPLLKPFAPAAQSIPADLRYVSRVRKFVDERTQSIAANYMKHMCFFNDDEKREMFTPEFLERTKSFSTIEWFEERFLNSKSATLPQTFMALDIRTYLPDDLLVKVDIASMACSLEARSPFLDSDLFQFAASLPIEFKIHNGQTKVLIREYFRDKLPASILTRSKMGFSSPIRFWFRKKFRFLEDTLLSKDCLNRGYFREESIRNLIRRHSSGAFDYSYKLYALLVLEIWHQLFVDRKAGATR
jgi:asparagine synthase (glutamine-hydrolysing)